MKEESPPKMKCYLMQDHEPGGRLYVVFGEDCVKAAEGLIARIGGNPDVNRFGLSGSWEVSPDTHIDASAWWPHFTTDPDRPSALDIIQGRA